MRKSWWWEVAIDTPIEEPTKAEDRAASRSLAGSLEQQELGYQTLGSHPSRAEVDKHSNLTHQDGSGVSLNVGVSRAHLANPNTVHV